MSVSIETFEKKISVLTTNLVFDKTQMAIVVSKMPNNYGIRGQEFVGKNRVVYAKEKSKYPSKIEIQVKKPILGQKVLSNIQIYVKN